VRHRLREGLAIGADLLGVLGFAILIWGLVGKQLQPLLALLPTSNAALVVLGAVLIGIDITIRLGSRPHSQSSPNISLVPRVPANPSAAGAATTSKPPERAPAPRIFVDRTPEDLTAHFKGVTTIQGEDRLARYIGKWLKVSGPLGDVAVIAPGIVRALFADRSLFTYNVVNMLFRHQQSNDRLVVMSPGDPITVVGEITSVDVQNVRLENCELI
jgi:hypothetical protein